MTSYVAENKEVTPPNTHTRWDGRDTPAEPQTDAPPKISPAERFKLDLDAANDLAEEPLACKEAQDKAAADLAAATGDPKLRWLANAIEWAEKQ